MKTLFKFPLLLLFAITIAQPASSQRLLRKLQDKVQQKVEEKVEERAEKKVDQVIDNQLDKIEESLEPAQTEETSGTTSREQADKARQERMQNILKGIGVSGEPVPVADSYSFNYLIEMQVESYNKDGSKESEGQFITHLNPDSKSMAYEIVSGNIGESQQGMFIIDAENGATIILNEENGEKKGIVYGMGAFFSSIGEAYQDETIEETPESYLLNPNVTKTGRTKNIAGYKCEEYRYSDEETESEIWITKDLKMNTTDFFSTLFKTSLYSRGIPWGYMMEVSTIDKQSKEKSIMQVTKVDSNSGIRFSMADYEVTNLGSFQMKTEQ